MLTQEAVQPGLGQAEAILRRRIEIADPGLPGGIEGPPRLLLAERAVEIPERRSAEAQRGEAELIPACRPENPGCDVEAHPPSPMSPGHFVRSAIIAQPM